MASKKPHLTDGELKGRIPANIILNDFCKEKNIVMALSQPQINFIDDGSLIIKAPLIIAKYKDEIVQPRSDSPQISIEKPKNGTDKPAI